MPAWDLEQETQVQVFMYFENSSDFFFQGFVAGDYAWLQLNMWRCRFPFIPPAWLPSSQTSLCQAVFGAWAKDTKIIQK